MVEKTSKHPMYYLKRLLKGRNLQFANKQTEYDYKLMKESNSMREFRVIALFLLILNTLTFVFAIEKKSWIEMYVFIGAIVVLLFLLSIQRYLKKHIQLVTLLVIVAFNMAKLGLVYVLYDYPTKTRLFYSGYGIATVQCILLLRLPNVSHKIWGTIIGLIVRFAYISASVEPGSFSMPIFLIHFVVDAFIIYTIYSQETISRKIFENFVQKKEELLKFKELLADDLPQSLVVITHKTNDLLFWNKAFQTTFNICNDDSDSLSSSGLQTSLESLIVEPSTLRETRIRNSPLELWNDGNSVCLRQAIENLSSKDCLENNTISLMAFSKTNKETRKLYEVTLKKVKWDSKDAIAVFFNDITYQESLIALKMANINKDKVIATVSHELRTPLHGIIGILEITENKVQDTEATKYLTLCKDNAHLLLSLVNSILDLQQISAGKLKLNIMRIDIRKIINNICQLFTFQCKQKNISLEYDIDRDVPPYISTDENRLKQILINLVCNAIKFTSKGRVTVRVSSCSERPEMLQISVTDTGIGIKKEDQKHLFKMYGKIEDEAGVNKNGVGLGLTISNALAQLLNGEQKSKGIEVESDYGKGSKVYFTIQSNLSNIPQIFPARTELTPVGKSIRKEDDTKSPDTFETFLAQKIGGSGYQQVENEGSDDDCQSNNNEFFVPSDLQYKMSSYVSLKRIVFPSAKKITDDITFENDLLLDRVNRKQTSHCLNLSLSLAPTPTSCDASKHFLIVDDNPFNLLVAQNLLRDFNCNIKTALSGEEAIKIITTSGSEGVSFKAIFMDCQMPVMDGFETTKSLRVLMEHQQVPEIPIFAWTANNSEEDIKRCFEAGMIGHLPKPTSRFDLEKLISKL